MSDSIILGYAYRYPWLDQDTILRFDTGGREINGGRPIESIPLCDARQLAAKDAEIARWKNQTMDARQLVRDQHAEIARLRRALEAVDRKVGELFNRDDGAEIVIGAFRKIVRRALNGNDAQARSE